MVVRRISENDGTCNLTLGAQRRTSGMTIGIRVPVSTPNILVRIQAAARERGALGLLLLGFVVGGARRHRERPLRHLLNEGKWVNDQREKTIASRNKNERQRRRRVSRRLGTWLRWKGRDSDDDDGQKGKRQFEAKAARKVLMARRCRANMCWRWDWSWWAEDGQRQAKRGMDSGRGRLLDSGDLLGKSQRWERLPELPVPALPELAPPPGESERSVLSTHAN